MWIGISENPTQSRRSTLRVLLRINEESATIYGFCTTSGQSQPDLCNRASLFDRITSRVGTRECLKPAASPAQKRDMRHVVLASVFPFFLSHVRSSARNRKLANTRGRDSSTMRKSLGREVIRAYTSFSNDAIPSDSSESSLLILFFFLEVCPTLRYRPLPLSAALIHG